MSAIQLSIDDIRQQVATQLNIQSSDILDDDDLFMLGLDSVSIMTLVGQWRDTGINIEFQDLVESPTLTAWEKQLNQK